MKYLDIDIKNNSGSELKYPENYQIEIGDFAVDHLYYDDDEGNPRLILLIEDVDFKESMIRERVSEITEADAKSKSEAKETRTETIKDEAKLRRLEIKARLGISLTTEELDSIDPEKPGSIFAVSDILADRIDNKKAKEEAKKIK